MCVAYVHISIASCHCEAIQMQHLLCLQNMESPEQILNAKLLLTKIGLA